MPLPQPLLKNLVFKGIMSQKSGWITEVSLVEEDQVREYLSHLDVCKKSLGPDEMHSQMLRDLADLTVRPHSIIFTWLWQVGEETRDKRKQMSILLSIQERQEGRPEELRASQSYQNVWKGDGTWNYSLKLFPGTGRKRISAGVISMDSPRGSHVWHIW